jgi:hypothetical protein
MIKNKEVRPATTSPKETNAHRQCVSNSIDVKPYKDISPEEDPRRDRDDIVTHSLLRCESTINSAIRTIDDLKVLGVCQ